jgi:very-short-patch-repair endonuclease
MSDTTTRYDWRILQEAYNKGASCYDLRTSFGVSRSSIHFAEKRGDIILRKTEIYGKPVADIDWKSVQAKYDTGIGVKPTYRFFGLNRYDIERAIKAGKFVKRTPHESMKLAKKCYPYKTSETTKAKLRQIQLRLIEERPELSPAHYHSSKKSYPETAFEACLLKNNVVGWKYNLPFGKYRFDFGFFDDKIDVEIDGSSHLEESVKEKDKRRDESSISKGWRVMRFTAKEVKKDSQKCVESVIYELENK